MLRASLTMLTEVANDARKIDRDPIYVNMLSAMLSSMIKWSENRLLDYHESFNRETVDLMENILPLAFSAVKILEESGYEDASDSSGNKVDHYIRSSLRKAFAKVNQSSHVSYFDSLTFDQLLNEYGYEFLTCHEAK